MLQLISEDCNELATAGLVKLKLKIYFKRAFFLFLVRECTRFFAGVNNKALVLL